MLPGVKKFDPGFDVFGFIICQADEFSVFGDFAGTDDEISDKQDFSEVGDRRDSRPVFEKSLVVAYDIEMLLSDFSADDVNAPAVNQIVIGAEIVFDVEHFRRFAVVDVQIDYFHFRYLPGNGLCRSRNFLCVVFPGFDDFAAERFPDFVKGHFVVVLFCRGVGPGPGAFFGTVEEAEVFQLFAVGIGAERPEPAPAKLQINIEIDNGVYNIPEAVGGVGVCPFALVGFAGCALVGVADDFFEVVVFGIDLLHVLGAPAVVGVVLHGELFVLAVKFFDGVDVFEKFKGHEILPPDFLKSACFLCCVVV